MNLWPVLVWYPWHPWHPWRPAANFSLNFTGRSRKCPNQASSQNPWRTKLGKCVSGITIPLSSWTWKFHDDIVIIVDQASCTLGVNHVVCILDSIEEHHHHILYLPICEMTNRQRFLSLPVNQQEQWLWLHNPTSKGLDKIVQVQPHRKDC